MLKKENVEVKRKSIKSINHKNFNIFKTEQENKKGYAGKHKETKMR